MVFSYIFRSFSVGPVAPFALGWGNTLDVSWRSSRHRESTVPMVGYARTRHQGPTIPCEGRHSPGDLRPLAQSQLLEVHYLLVELRFLFQGISQSPTRAGGKDPTQPQRTSQITLARLVCHAGDSDFGCRASRCSAFPFLPRQSSVF